MRIQFLLFILSFVSFFASAYSSECEDCTRADIIDRIGDRLYDKHIQIGQDNKAIILAGNLPYLLSGTSKEFGVTSLTQEEQSLIYYHVLMKSTAYGTWPENRSEEAISILRSMGQNPDQYLQYERLLNQSPDNFKQTYDIAKQMDPAMLKSLFIYGTNEAFRRLNESEKYPGAITHIIMNTISQPDELLQVMQNSDLESSDDPVVISNLLEIFAKIDFRKANANTLCTIQRYLSTLVTEERIEKTKGILSFKSAQVQKLLNVPSMMQDLRCLNDERTLLSEQLQDIAKRLSGIINAPTRASGPISPSSSAQDDRCSDEDAQKFIQETATQYFLGNTILGGIQDRFGCTVTVVMRPAVAKKKVKGRKPQIEIRIAQQSKSGLRRLSVSEIEASAIKEILSETQRIRQSGGGSPGLLQTLRNNQTQGSR